MFQYLPTDISGAGFKGKVNDALVAIGQTAVPSGQYPLPQVPDTYPISLPKE